MLDAWEWCWHQGDPRKQAPSGIISKKHFGEILFFGEIKVGLLQICNFFGSFGTHLLRTLFLVCKKNGALALTVKKLRVCMCVISLFATINIYYKKSLFVPCRLILNKRVGTQATMPTVIRVGDCSEHRRLQYHIVSYYTTLHAK